jgi:hypothetical protein
MPSAQRKAVRVRWRVWFGAEIPNFAKRWFAAAMGRMTQLAGKSQAINKLFTDALLARNQAPVNRTH